MVNFLESLGTGLQRFGYALQGPDKLAEFEDSERLRRMGLPTQQSQLQRIGSITTGQQTPEFLMKEAPEQVRRGQINQLLAIGTPDAVKLAMQLNAPSQPLSSFGKVQADIASGAIPEQYAELARQSVGSAFGLTPYQQSQLAQQQFQNQIALESLQRSRAQEERQQERFRIEKQQKEMAAKEKQAAKTISVKSGPFAYQYKDPIPLDAPTLRNVRAATSQQAVLNKAATGLRDLVAKHGASIAVNPNLRKRAVAYLADVRNAERTIANTGVLNIGEVPFLAESYSEFDPTNFSVVLTNRPQDIAKNLNEYLARRNESFALGMESSGFVPVTGKVAPKGAQTGINSLPAGATPAGQIDGKNVYQLPNGDLVVEE